MASDGELHMIRKQLSARIKPKAKEESLQKIGQPDACVNTIGFLNFKDPLQ